MRSSVKAFWFDYSIHHEGFTPFLYADALNLVTTGIGNLVDLGPRNDFVVNSQVMSPAMSLPWRKRAAGWTSSNPLAGELVSPAEVADAWTAVKLKEQQSPGFNKKGGFAYAGLTSITLDMNGIKTLFNNKTDSVNKELIGLYPNFEQLAADAQFAMMSMSWAMGGHFWPAIKSNGKPAFQAAMS